MVKVLFTFVLVIVPGLCVASAPCFPRSDDVAAVKACLLSDRSFGRGYVLRTYVVGSAMSVDVSDEFVRDKFFTRDRPEMDEFSPWVKNLQFSIGDCQSSVRKTLVICNRKMILYRVTWRNCNEVLFLLGSQFSNCD